MNITIYNTDRTVDLYIKNRKQLEIITNDLIKFTKYLKPNANVLDLGCGHGRDCKYFEEHGFDTTGIDLSENMLKVARDICNKSNLICMDINDVCDKDWKFDGIWACASLYHLDKSKFNNLINNLHKIINKNGIVYIAMKKGSGERYIFKREFRVYKFYSLYHENELVDIFERNGFEILDMEVRDKKYSMNKKDVWIVIIARRK